MLDFYANPLRPLALLLSFNIKINFEFCCVLPTLPNVTETKLVHGFLTIHLDCCYFFNGLFLCNVPAFRLSSHALALSFPNLSFLAHLPLFTPSSYLTLFSCFTILTFWYLTSTEQGI